MYKVTGRMFTLVISVCGSKLINPFHPGPLFTKQRRLMGIEMNISAFHFVYPDSLWVCLIASRNLETVDGVIGGHQGLVSLKHAVDLTTASGM